MILVTGASGFIGRACIDVLQQKNQIICTTTKALPAQEDKNITWLNVNLHDYSAVKNLLATFKPDVLLHLAWYVEHGLYWSSNENIKWVASSLNLVQEFINNGGQKLVCAGTCAEYDWSNEYCSQDLTENQTPINPSTLYGASKASLHTTINDLAKNKGITFAWGRLFFPYGPNEAPKRLIPSTISSLLAGKTVSCNNPQLERDFIFIQDVARIFKKLVEGKVNGPINIGSGKPVKLKDVVQLIANELNAQELVEHKAETKETIKPTKTTEATTTIDPVRLVASTDRLKNDLSILPETSLLSGIKETIAWWQGNYQP